MIAFGAHWARGHSLKEEVKMNSLTSRLCRDESGATATEYAMLLVFVALAIAVAAQTFGTNLGDLFTRAGATLTGITIPTP